MRFVLIFLSIFWASNYAEACLNKITPGEAEKAIRGDITATPGCEEMEICLCYDGIDWGSAEIIRQGDTVALVNNPEKRAEKEDRELSRKRSREEREQRKEQAKKELSQIDWAQANSIAKLKQILKAVVDNLEND